MKIENLMPIALKEMHKIAHAQELLMEKEACVSFQKSHCAIFEGKGSYVILDFGKEVCGGVRFITREAKGLAKFAITLGESLSEACAPSGFKNAGNDHATRELEVAVPFMSDLTFGQSGFRFAKIELLTEAPVHIRNIFAVNHLPVFPKEGYLRTADAELNAIIQTAIYTLRLNFQNGYIWDGIKRDRMVWSGDLNQEIITSIYLFGDNPNITNSLNVLKNETPATRWINEIPSYSAWWIINLCDYCAMTHNDSYFAENVAYAHQILAHFDSCIQADGTMDFGDVEMAFYLDWPTYQTQDAPIGTAALICMAANAFGKMYSCAQPLCHSIVGKLKSYLAMDCRFKQTRAFQILAGRDAAGEVAFLEQDGAKGLSTFMTYYILKADAIAGGTQMVSLIKEYFGAMLSRGATTFWEDFNIEWLEGSGRIDALPAKGQKDIHGDFGAFCYTGFRHSLCHGWSAGFVAFLIEYILDGALQGKNNPVWEALSKVDASLYVGDHWITLKK